MALLRKCCCNYTVRQGSFGAGSYTLVYFIIFALLTGNYSYHEVMSRYHSTPTPTHPAPHPNVNHATINVTNLTTPYNGSLEHHHHQQLKPVPMSEILLVAVDFVCEICGIVASILLLRGLQCDLRSYLVPWLVVVPLHTLIDTFTVINIIILYMEHINQPAPPPHLVLDPEQVSAEKWWGVVTILTVIVDFILNSINVYAFLCVLSQYQEYLGGRGSAAYENCRRQEQLSVVRYEARGSGSGLDRGQGQSTSSRRPNGNNPCFSDGDKSDLWCDDLVLDKLDMDTSTGDGGCTPEDGKSGRKKGRKSSNITVTTTCVRFEGEEDGQGPLMTAATSQDEPKVTLLHSRKP